MRHWSKSTAVLATVCAIAGLTLVGAPAAQAATSMPCAAVRGSGPNLDDGWGVMKGSYNLKVKPKMRSCNERRIKGTRTHGCTSVANFRSVHGSSYPKCWNKSKDHT
ncbi:hypothetical protein E1267_32415 [Nonomuraea longispora]|uniref:Secreted protein n=1 Tax=Nonomuraea longispora TaxID=1848320 RepID=A0A4R4N2E8_9ACTN|nr:hypothetical protein [Nonomuraea longispora]TDC01253.1 hypothetical protein E1267_32415 [Nonomuraea longispora]